MILQSLLAEPGRVDEPQAAQEYSDVLSQVAAEGKPLIVRRNGEDLAAVIPLKHLELLREVVARQEVGSWRCKSSGAGCRRVTDRRKSGSTILIVPLSQSRSRNRDGGSASAVGQCGLGRNWRTATASARSAPRLS